MDTAINKEEVAAYEKNKTEGDNQKYDPSTIVRPRIKMSSCLEVFAKTETVEHFYSTAINGNTTAHK